MNDEFYIGYEDQCPPGLARFVRRGIVAVGLLVFLTAPLIAWRQQPVDSGRFEFGVTRTFEGVLYETPLPMLRIVAGDPDRPAAANLLLVGFGKSGLPEFARGHDGRKVRFNGTLIYRRNMTMVELNDARSFEVLGEPQPWEQRSRAESLGPATFTGELVDTKCFFGVMRPANGKVHRACAVRCLSGGVPPGLLVRDDQGNGVVVMLAGPEGRPLEYDVELAARVLTATGTLELHDGVPVLRVAEWLLQRQ